MEKTQKTQTAEEEEDNEEKLWLEKAIPTVSTQIRQTKRFVKPTN